MHHVHMETCPSTQDYLKKNLEEFTSIDSDVLVSTNFQTEGKGRQGNVWLSNKDSLTFSFTLKPNDEVTLTPLEVAALLIDFFFKKNSSLVLKWPNDILTPDGKKCGGILCNYINSNFMLVGIGLNFGLVPIELQKICTYKVGSVEEKIHLDDEKRQSWPEEIYNFILENRLSPDSVRNLWNKSCFHHMARVEIKDGNFSSKGIFIGIGSKGEALLDMEGVETPILTGSLFID